MTFEDWEQYNETGITDVGYNDRKKIGLPVYKMVLNKMLEGSSFTSKELDEKFGGVRASYIIEKAKEKGLKVISEKQIVKHEASNKKYCYLKYRIHSKHLKA